MHIRHDKYDLLERLLKDNGGTGLALHIEHKVNGVPTPDFYHSLDALHMQKKKIQASSIKLKGGHPMPIYMTTIPEDKFVSFNAFHSKINYIEFDFQTFESN